MSEVPLYSHDVQRHPHCPAQRVGHIGGGGGYPGVGGEEVRPPASEIVGGVRPGAGVPRS